MRPTHNQSGNLHVYIVSSIKKDNVHQQWYPYHNQHCHQPLPSPPSATQQQQPLPNEAQQHNHNHQYPKFMYHSNQLEKVMSRIIEDYKRNNDAQFFVFIEQGSHQCPSYCHLLRNEKPLCIQFHSIPSLLLQSVLEQPCSTTQELISKLTTIIGSNDEKFAEIGFMNNPQHNILPFLVPYENAKIQLSDIGIVGHTVHEMSLAFDDLTLQNCSLRNMKLICKGKSQLRMTGCRMSESVLEISDNCAVNLVNNDFKQNEECLIKIRDQATVDLDSNTFTLANTAVELLLSAQPGFGCHVHIQNNFISNCNFGVSCISDSRCKEENSKQISSKHSHYSIHMHDNICQDIKSIAIAVSALLKARIHNNTIQQPVFSTEETYGIFLSNGSDCIVTSNRIIATQMSNFSGIIVLDEVSKAQIRFNKISYCRVGIHCENGSCSEICDNEIIENIINILVEDHKTSALVLDNELINGDFGIVISNFAYTLIKRNIISRMAFVGIHVLKNAQKCLNNTRIMPSKTQQLDNNRYFKQEPFSYLYDENQLNMYNAYPSNARCFIQNNRIYENNVGIHAEDCGSVIMDNDIYGNLFNILIEFMHSVPNVELFFPFEAFKVLVNRNKIYDSRFEGIQINTASVLEVDISFEENEIYGCQGFGFLIHGSSTYDQNRIKPLIHLKKNNVHSSNGDANIRICDNVGCQLEDNNIQGSIKGSGIEILNGAYCILKRNRIYNNSIYGLLLDGALSAAELEENIIFGNEINIRVESVTSKELAHLAKTIIISRNKVLNAKLDNIQLKFCITEIRSSSKQQKKLIIFENSILEASRYGICIEEGSYNISISSNNLKGNGKATIFPINLRSTHNIQIEDNVS